MRRNLIVILLLFQSICICACAHQPKDISNPVSKGAELNTVANNISLKTGTNFDGDIILNSIDLIGFNYTYDEKSQQYVFNFKLSDEGQKKMAEATKKLAETSGELSLWIGDELIVSPKVMVPITGDEFVINRLPA